MDQRTRPNQSGFRPGRGCTDQMHNLRRTLEQRWSFSKLLLCASLILLLRLIPWTGTPYGGWNATQTLEADQVVLLIDRDEG